MCVIVQYNDPDPWLWMLLYTIASIIMFFAGMGIQSVAVIIFAYLIYGTGFVWLAPSVVEFITKEQGNNFMMQMNNEKMYIEETRECLGLFIILIFISLIWIPVTKKYQIKQH
ncbi:MAG: transmembrane 220 family protein [Cytophagales bacterium]|nr:transmembrane 220 family protein [Cytophagales bacterium]